MKTFSLLGVPVHLLLKSGIEAKLSQALRQSTFRHIATVNPEFLVTAQNSAEFKHLLQQKTWLNICDGVGIQLLSRIFYGQFVPRISGVSLALLLCNICEQERKSVALVGGFGVVKKSAEFLRRQFPNLNIIYAEDGCPSELDPALKNAKPDLLLVAFGAPRQEFWLQKFGIQTGAKIGVGVGGTFDFWAGKVQRAPEIFQTLGLEWVWRLFQEPQRFPRIFRAVVVFTVLAWKERFSR